MRKTFYLMRHGETLFNTQKRVQGWCDSPLTENGIELAKEVGRYFDRQGIVFDVAYSSTQERATDTLKLVTDAPYQQAKGLKEMNFGIFEAREEVLLPKFRPGSRSFEDLLVPFGGEDIRDVGKRVRDTIISIMDKNLDKTVLMVSHGAAIWGLVQVLGITLPEGVYLPNCAVCQMTYNDGHIEFKQIIDPNDNFIVHNI